MAPEKLPSLVQWYIDQATPPAFKSLEEAAAYKPGLIGGGLDLIDRNLRPGAELLQYYSTPSIMARGLQPLAKYVVPSAIAAGGGAIRGTGEFLGDPYITGAGGAVQAAGEGMQPPPAENPAARAAREAAAADLAAKVKAVPKAGPVIPDAGGDKAPPKPETGLRAVLRDGKTVFLAGDVEGGKPIDYKQAVAAERSKGIAKALAEGNDYIGGLQGIGPGGITQTDRVKLATMLPGGGAASMMTALPGSDQALEIAGRELAAEERKTAIAEAAKPPAQRIAEAAEARAGGEVKGRISAGITVPQAVVEGLRQSPQYAIRLKSAEALRDKALAELDANLKLTDEERKKRVAVIQAAFAGAPDGIIQNMIEEAAKVRGDIRGILERPGERIVGSSD